MSFRATSTRRPRSGTATSGVASRSEIPVLVLDRAAGSGAVSLFSLRLVHGDRVDAHPQTGEIDSELGGRSRRGVLREEIAGGLVHCLEVPPVPEQYRRPPNGAPCES